ncbi:MAG TPA: class I SAM-dependent methyltransferase [Chloroflexia bacterium]|nr:class I SAM-dependent methyltransferase [Chloroflexia bacterium]
MALDLRDPQSIISTGQETLRRMASVDNYNSWIYELMRPHLGRRIAEVGCGIGNMTEYLLGADLLLAFDILPESAAWVGDKFKGRPNVQVRQGDLCDAGFVTEASRLCFDTVVSINMLEHIQDDRKALSHMHTLLGRDGRLLLFVPAGPYMFGTLDISLGHFRRYDKKGLSRKVRQAGFHVEKLHYVNILGVAGWLLNSRILRRKILPKDQLGFFNTLAPLLQAAEKRFQPPFGQSLLCVASKKR